MQEGQKKRVFFGIEVHAPWPQKLPPGRLLAPEGRHFTLAFLGRCEYGKLLSSLKRFPIPPFAVGLVGKFDAPWFIPKRDPRLVAWHGFWLEEDLFFLRYQQQLCSWLEEIGFPVDNRHGFNPHVTLCRRPEKLNEWEETFTPLPFFVQDIHLFESLGHSEYASIWHHTLLPPFIPLEHTADLAFVVYGKCLTTLFAHAQVALCFTFPKLLDFLSKPKEFTTLHDVIIELNNVVSLADQEIGAPFKAVSFHGHVKKENDHLRWEMIIDV